MIKYVVQFTNEMLGGIRESEYQIASLNKSKHYSKDPKQNGYFICPASQIFYPTRGWSASHREMFTSFKLVLYAD